MMFKPTNIATSEDIFKACTEMQNFLEADYASDNGDAVMNRAQALESYMALSGKLLADAKYNYAQLLQSEFVDALKRISDLSPSIAAKYIDTMCRDVKYLVDWCDRINRASTHQLEVCRSVLSTLREEFKANVYSKTT